MRKHYEMPIEGTRIQQVNVGVSEMDPIDKPLYPDF